MGLWGLIRSLRHGEIGRDWRPRWTWWRPRRISLALPIDEGELRRELKGFRELRSANPPDAVLNYLTKLERRARGGIKPRTRAELFLRMGTVLLDMEDPPENVLALCRAGLERGVDHAETEKLKASQFWLVVRGVLRKLDKLQAGSDVERRDAAAGSTAGARSLRQLMRANRLHAASLYDDEGVGGLADAGDLYLAGGRVDLARACIESAQAKDARGAAAIDTSRLEFLRGRCCFLERDTTEATNAFRNAVSLGYSSGGVAEWLTGCYLELGRPDEALVAVDEALAAEGKSAQTERLRRVRGDVLMANGRIEEAVADYRSLCTESDEGVDDEAWFGWGLAELTRGDISTAEELFLRIDVDAENGILRRYARGLAAAAKDDCEEAVRLLEPVVDAWPWIVGARQRLGESLLGSGCCERALDVLVGVREEIGADDELDLDVMRAAVGSGRIDVVMKFLPDTDEEGSSRCIDESWRSVLGAARDEAVRRVDFAAALKIQDVLETSESGNSGTDPVRGYLLYEVARRRIAENGRVDPEPLEMLASAVARAPEIAAAGGFVAKLALDGPDEARRYLEEHAAGIDGAFTATVREFLDWERPERLVPGDVRALGRLRGLLGHLVEGGKFTADLGNELSEVLADPDLAEAVAGQRDWLECSLARTAFGMKRSNQRKMVALLNGLSGEKGSWSRLRDLLGIRDDRKNEDAEALEGRLAALKAAAVDDPLTSELVGPVARATAAIYLKKRNDYGSDTLASAIAILADLDEAETAACLGRRDHTAAAMAEALGHDDDAYQIRAELADEGDTAAVHQLAVQDFAAAQIAAVEGDFESSLERFRSGVEQWRTLLDDEAFWDRLGAKLESVKYSSGMSIDPVMIQQLRKKWPGFLVDLITKMERRARRLEQTSAADRAAELVAAGV